MQKSLRLGLLGLCVSTMLAGSVWASESGGQQLTNNILGGALSGTLIGLSAGSWAYGAGGNYQPEYFVTGAIYGFLGGALLGTSVGIYEINTERTGSGYVMSQYVSGATFTGVLVGGVASMIPYMQDKNGAVITKGMGIGGVIGGALGLTLGILEISKPKPVPMYQPGQQKLSAQIGIISVASCLPSVIPGMEPDPIVNCQVVKITF
jgi:hypothetical protein